MHAEGEPMKAFFNAFIANPMCTIVPCIEPLLFVSVMFTIRYSTWNMDDNDNTILLGTIQ